ncbi:MAG TPA: hypothetical protein VF867_19485 [Arthrobacter sp.]
MANAYPRESVEFQPVQVTQDGQALTSGLSFAVVRDGQRPVTFSPATIMGTSTGVMVAGLAAGTYRIYAQLTTGVETPVIDCGYFYVD